MDGGNRMSPRTALASLALVLVIPAAGLADTPPEAGPTEPAAMAEPVSEPTPAVSGDAKAKPDFSRPGWYLGVGGAYGVDFFGDDIEKAARSIGVDVSIKDTGGVNARGGYRVASWFAAELMYEWMDNFGVEVDSIDPGGEPLPLGIELSKYTTHTITANLKFIVPTWRFQPYILLGLGAQYYDLKAPDVVQETAFDFTESGWAVAGRPGVGMDVYITENLLVNVEVDGVLATANPNTIPDIGDLFYLTVGGGLQWRF